MERMAGSGICSISTGMGIGETSDFEISLVVFSLLAETETESDAVRDPSSPALGAFTIPPRCVLQEVAEHGGHHPAIDVVPDLVAEQSRTPSRDAEADFLRVDIVEVTARGRLG
jgi:hypothetical protein